MTTQPIPAHTRVLRRALSPHECADLLALLMSAALPALLLMVPVPLVRVPVGVAVALFAPGYALAAVLFPRRDDLDAPARIGMSFVLSVALLPLLVLVLNALPWGITPWPIAAGLGAWIAPLACVALTQRSRIVGYSSGEPFGRPAVRRTVVITLGALLVSAALGAVGQGLFAPEPPPTEFYMLAADGTLLNYPRNETVGEPLEVNVGIVNNAQAQQTFHIQVWQTDALNPAQRSLLLEATPRTLAAGQRDEHSLQWTMPRVGNDQRIELLLVRQGETQPYRRLVLWANIFP